MDFTSRMESDGFNGDLAHLVSFDGGGGIAYLSVVCSSWGTGYSGISTWYNDVPNYSWTIEVIAHELGHNFGSPHTHSCSWGDNWNQPIDCCGIDAGYGDSNCSCDDAISTDADMEGGGTIMSYCHLTGTGIDLRKGFGPLVK